MNLISVYKIDEADELLYEWLRERSEEKDRVVNISHRKLPTWQQHLKFFHSKPYRHWFLIEVNGQYVGYVFATERNEIGIVLKGSERGKGYGSLALREFMRLCKPLPELPSRRRGCWLANINPANEVSKHVFEKLGFRRIQETYALEEDIYAQSQSQAAPA